MLASQSLKFVETILQQFGAISFFYFSQFYAIFVYTSLFITFVIEDDKLNK